MKENQREREEDRRLPGCTLEALGNLTLKGMNRRNRRSVPDTPFSLTVCTHTHTCRLVISYKHSPVLLCCYEIDSMGLSSFSMISLIEKKDGIRLEEEKNNRFSIGISRRCECRLHVREYEIH
jgi:hypothetical protein